MTVGAAVHSVRAVSPEDVAVIARELPEDVPLHVHLSEQPAENAQSLAAWGARPTRVLADAGALSTRLSVVHATHLDDDEIGLLGGAEVTAVLCPTTEADLGDGIGPARRLADAGATIALGSDQNAVVDPFLEVRGLEAGERLGARRRGVFTPAELDAARSTAGYRSLGCPAASRSGRPVTWSRSTRRASGRRAPPCRSSSSPQPRRTSGASWSAGSSAPRAADWSTVARPRTC